MSNRSKQSPKKGMGKTKEQRSSSKSKSVDATDVAPRECMLSFPLLKTADNERILPRYSAILSRTEQDGVGMEDLDSLQLELESLLSAVVVRSRILKGDVTMASSTEERREKKSKSCGRPPSSPGKKGKHQEKSSKRLKEIGKSRLDPMTKVKVLPNRTYSPPQNILPQIEPVETVDRSKPAVPKNDTPNKFWTSVEPYCSDITSEDVKLLEDLTQDHEKDPEYQKIPPLGRHYSLRWAQEDLIEEQDSGSAQGKNRSRQTNNIEVNDIVKNEKAEVVSGPLTQRLISALMEENIMTPDPFENKRLRAGENNRSAMFLNYSINNSSIFERRVRKELEEQGILDPNDYSKDVADDEILAELKRCQAELKVISSHNCAQLKRLHKLATESMVRQDLKRKLRHIDNEIMEVYKKITVAKLMKETNKKDQDYAWKLLKDRENLLKQIV